MAGELEVLLVVVVGLGETDAGRFTAVTFGPFGVLTIVLPDETAPGPLLLPMRS
jgi:hypothetical protein